MQRAASTTVDRTGNNEDRRYAVERMRIMRAKRATARAAVKRLEALGPWSPEDEHLGLEVRSDSLARLGCLHELVSRRRCYLILRGWFVSTCAAWVVALLYTWLAGRGKRGDSRAAFVGLQLTVPIMLIGIVMSWKSAAIPQDCSSPMKERDCGTGGENWPAPSSASAASSTSRRPLKSPPRASDGVIRDLLVEIYEEEAFQIEQREYLKRRTRRGARRRGSRRGDPSEVNTSHGNSSCGDDSGWASVLQRAASEGNEHTICQAPFATGLQRDLSHRSRVGNGRSDRKQQICARSSTHGAEEFKDDRDEQYLHPDESDSSDHKTLNLDGSLSESVSLGSSQGRFDRSIRHNEVKTRHSLHRSEETVEATMLTTTPAVPGPSSSLLILTAKQALLLPSSLVGIYFSTCRVLLWWFVYYPLRIAWFFPAFVWARFFSLLKPRESARETREEKKNGG